MEITRSETAQSGTATIAQPKGRAISVAAAQVLATIITITLFSGIAGALHLLFERMAAS